MEASSRLSGLKGVLFACVGKPSAGKSTLLNAISEGQAHAKMGNFPFTTIGPPPPRPGPHSTLVLSFCS